MILTVGQLLDRAQVQGVAKASVDALGATWQRTLDGAVSRWQAEVSPRQQAAAEPQIEAAVHLQSVAGLAALTVPALGDDLLLDVMRVMAASGVASVVAEAAAAGATVRAPVVASVTLVDWAKTTAELLAGGYAAGVAREALRLFRPRATAADVIAGVRAYRDRLTDRPIRDVIGGALTRAQNLGRLAVYERPPPRWRVELVADERLDSNTCVPCRRVDGEVLPTVEAAALAYGGAGYLLCDGGPRCRGTMTGRWTQEGS